MRVYRFYDGVRWAVDDGPSQHPFCVVFDTFRRACKFAGLCAQNHNLWEKWSAK
jgi:hypothetical protein